MERRTLYYAAQAIEHQGGAPGKWGYEIKAVYCIAFMNFTDPGLAPRVRVDAAICDRDTGSQISDLLRFVYLQLPLFNKQSDECETFFERWIYVLKNMDILDDLPKAFQCEAFKKLKEVTDTTRMNAAERQEYENTLRIYRDQVMMYENAVNKGREEEHKKFIKAARDMKSAGVPVETIKQSFGLTDEEISSLIN
jgi:predicted transposase/invertase (TIGR01784 family)